MINQYRFNIIDSNYLNVSHFQVHVQVKMNEIKVPNYKRDSKRGFYP